MAGGGLLALLDDISVLLDDIAAMSKVAAAKTIGISGDDLAVNSNVIVGIDPNRELPVVWSVAKGSFKNKLYLIPGALVLNFAAPALITPLLMLGGAYLCYEGMEKVLHRNHDNKDDKHHRSLTAAALKSPAALEAFEREKIKGAINTDLILSAEIIAVTLGAVAAAPFLTQVAVLATVGVFITVGIYGLVAAIVKLDDLGLHLAGKKHALTRKIGTGLVNAAPKIMKTLAIVGTVAMLLVGGELIIHGLPALEHLIHALKKTISEKSFVQSLVGITAALTVGVIAGLAAILAMKAASTIYTRAAKRK